MAENLTPEAGFAARYARALYDAAFESGQLDSVIDQMAALSRLIDESQPLRRLLAHRPGDADAAPILDRLLADQQFSKLVRNFVQVAAGNRRLPDLAALVSGFKAHIATKRGEIAAEVTTAHPLTDLQRNQLRARLAESGYSRVTLRERVEPGVLGGLALKIGAKLYDTTLKSRLDRLTYSLKGAA